VSARSHVLESVCQTDLESHVSSLNTVNLESRGESISPWVIDLWLDVENEDCCDWCRATARWLVADVWLGAIQYCTDGTDITWGNSSCGDDSNQDGVEQVELSNSHWEGNVSIVHVSSGVCWESGVSASEDSSLSKECNEQADKDALSDCVGDVVGGCSRDRSVEIRAQRAGNESTEGVGDQKAEKLDVGDVQSVRVTIADRVSASRIAADQWLG